MTQSKHTRGPWKIYRGEVCYISQEEDQSFGMSCQLDLNNEANARLISAAPELLDALIKLRNDAYNAYADNTCNDAFSVADAAIAKATGQA